MHPPRFYEVVDSQGVTHWICVDAIRRITMTGTGDVPGVEIWIQFGGTVELSGDQATAFLYNLRRGWGYFLEPREQVE